MCEEKQSELKLIANQQKKCFFGMFIVSANIFTGTLLLTTNNSDRNSTPAIILLIVCILMSGYLAYRYNRFERIRTFFEEQPQI